MGELNIDEIEKIVVRRTDNALSISVQLRVLPLDRFQVYKDQDEGDIWKARITAPSVFKAMPGVALAHARLVRDLIPLARELDQSITKAADFTEGRIRVEQQDHVKGVVLFSDSEGLLVAVPSGVRLETIGFTQKPIGNLSEQ